jgi:nucleoside-diphosphate-sugar epimerase
MRIFVTGASGFVGSAVVKELIQSGHKVLGFARSEASAEIVKKLGAEVLKGDLTDWESLKKGAVNADAVIHTGFIHDFSKFKENCEIDKRAIETLGTTLAGSNRPLIVTSGTGLLPSGVLSTEYTHPPAISPTPRVSEQTVDTFLNKGVKVMTVRLPPSVHGDGDHGFIPMLITRAREKKLSAYIGDGNNQWSTVHRFDAARVFSLAVEKGSAGMHYHAVAEQGIPFKEIATIIGKKLNLPVTSLSGDKTVEHFEWFTHFAMMDCPSSSKVTQEALGWHATEKTLIDDLMNGKYF